MRKTPGLQYARYTNILHIVQVVGARCYFVPPTEVILRPAFIDSPDSPAGLALDGDKSVWVVGQYQGGIVVNFTNAVLNQPGSFGEPGPTVPIIGSSWPGCCPGHP
jgi:hypothetical protein